MHRVLVISHNSFSKVFNNGKTLEAIFDKYPKENLAQLFFSENEAPDYDFCENFFKITDADVAKNVYSGSKYGQALKRNNDICKMSNNNNKAESKIKSRFKRSKYTRLLRDILWSLNSWKTPGLYAWIENFKPTIIFFMGGNLAFSHRIAVHLSNKYNIPLAVFFTDDYLIYPLRKSLFDKIEKYRMIKFYTKTVKKSVLGFAIGEEMAKTYKNYFKKDFLPIMNSINNPNLPDREFYFKQKYVIRYFGGLHLDRWRMIGRLGKLLNEISNESDIHISLEVFSASVIERKIINSFTENYVDYKGKVVGEELEQMMIECDALLHTESDTEFLRSLTRLSVSTKIPEYLSVGTPVIAFGPPEVASIKLLSDYNLGLVLNSNLEEGLNKKLIVDFFNAADLKKFSLRSKEFARSNFDKSINSEDFRKRLEKIK